MSSHNHASRSRTPLAVAAILANPPNGALGTLYGEGTYTGSAPR